MRISDWSSDVCSSDLSVRFLRIQLDYQLVIVLGSRSGDRPSCCASEKRTLSDAGLNCALKLFRRHRMSNRMAGKVALVTGAASGLGAAQARLFAKEGAKVVVADRSAERRVGKEGGSRCRSRWSPDK